MSHRNAALDRRSILRMVAAVALVAIGCSPKTKATGSPSDSVAGGGPSPTSGLTPSGTSSPTSAAPPASASPSPSLVPESERIPQAVLVNDAQGYNGTWRATWKDSDGRSGRAALVMNIDPKTRTATATLSLAPGFFGVGSPTVSDAEHVNLDDYSYEAKSQGGTSNLFGSGTLTRFGVGQVRVQTTDLPGHPEIASFTAVGQLVFLTALPFTYAIVRTDGSKSTGSARFTR